VDELLPRETRPAPLSGAKVGSMRRLCKDFSWRDGWQRGKLHVVDRCHSVGLPLAYRDRLEMGSH
jgi:hypothetical protein